jgi:hypothetical protein
VKGFDSGFEFLAVHPVHALPKLLYPLVVDYFWGYPISVFLKKGEILTVRKYIALVDQSSLLLLIFIWLMA